MKINETTNKQRNYLSIYNGIRKVDVDMLNAVKSVLADVTSGGTSSNTDEGLTFETRSANTLFTTFSISISTLRSYIVRSYRHADADQK